MKIKLLFYILISTTYALYAQPPYWGTNFIDPNDIIIASDPSAYQSTTYIGKGMVTMYDRRVPAWITVNAYLFEVVWDDGLTTRAQINPEFGSVAAARIEAERYGFLVGQLPNVLRKDVNELWIHKGNKLFGGGNNSILIHTGQAEQYENDGNLESTLIHEATHTSLDAAHQSSSGWINAQNLDIESISTYARDNPIIEDIAESFLVWLAVRHRKDRISQEDFDIMTKTIPNRLSYFDTFDFDLYPMVNTLSNKQIKSQNTTIYHDPISNIIKINGPSLTEEDVKIYSIIGQDVTHKTILKQNKMDISKITNGYYILKVNTIVKKIHKYY